LRIFIDRDPHCAVGCGSREVEAFATGIQCRADGRLAAKNDTIGVHKLSHRLRCVFAGEYYYKSTTTESRFRQERKDEGAKSLKPVSWLLWLERKELQIDGVSHRLVTCVVGVQVIAGVIGG